MTWVPWGNVSVTAQLTSAMFMMLFLSVAPTLRIKFFATEALHRVGGLVFDTHGNRFANELKRKGLSDRRDVEE